MNWNSDEKKKRTSLNTNTRATMLQEIDLDPEIEPPRPFFIERSGRSKSSPFPVISPDSRGV
jgi:hypothetical protein